MFLLIMTKLPWHLKFAYNNYFRIIGYHKFTGVEELDCVYEKGPALRVDGGHSEGQEVHCRATYDIVRSIPCPYWPPEATGFRMRSGTITGLQKALLMRLLIRDAMWFTFLIFAAEKYWTEHNGDFLSLERKRHWYIHGRMSRRSYFTC